MSRQIIIDEDTLIGYDYPNKQYYITNKETTTHRATSEQAKRVLDIVAPSNGISIQDIQYLEDHYETLSTLHYTLSAKGDYISTIQINDYKTHPLTLDSEKHKLYIMNTNIVYDLTLQEGMPTKVATVQDYFKRQLGVFLDSEDTLTLLTLLEGQYYNTSTYLQVRTPQTTEEPIFYSNVIGTRDYTDEYPVHYSLTLNPTQEYTYPTHASISEINNNRVLTLTNYDTLQLQVGDRIVVANSTDAESYLTSDGTYTVSAVELPYIKVAESINTYATQYKPVYLVSPVLQVQSASRGTNTITTTEAVPSSVLIGDTIYLEGTTTTVDFQEVSIDGVYTVKQISDDTITVEEQIPTDYTTTEPSTNTLTKRVPLGDLLACHGRTLTISKKLPTLTNQVILLDDSFYTIVSNTPNTITVAEDIEDYTPPYAELQIPTPYTYVLVDVSKSNANNMPVGSFMVDNYTEANSYLALGTTLQPTDEQYDMADKKVPTEYHIGQGLPTMHLMGLYTEIYKES